MIKALYIVSFVSFIFPYATAQETFTNPLFPSGADPWSIYKDGYYYYTHTTGKDLTIWKTRSLTALKTAKKKTVWKPPAQTIYSKQIWAPELHFIDGKWYMYFAADDGVNENHRMYVIENASVDPLEGEWIFKGKVADPSDKWAIDGSVFRHKGQLYMVWSGWEGDENGRQDIYISKMKDPLTIEGNRVRLSTPTYDWELHGDLNDPLNPPHVAVNEGPQLLKHDDRLFLIYSASGCWTDYYSLGMLSFTGDSDLLDASKWEKHPELVFTQTPENEVYAPGHNSFFKSPDGTEDWILYHANSASGQGCGKDRSPRAQKFKWKDNGTPDFGVPVKTGIDIPVPSE